MNYYKGNSIKHWYNKAIAYKRTINDLWDILGPYQDGPVDIRDLVKNLIDKLKESKYDKRI